MADFLKYLTEADQEGLRAHADRVGYEEDDTIIREGEERNAIFVIRKGTVRIERSHMDFRYEIARLETGEVFGEMGFVEGFVASADVVANEQVEVEVFAAQHVRALEEGDPGFSGRFYKSLSEILSQRLRETTVRSVSDYTWGGTDPRHRRTRPAELELDEDGWPDPDWDIDDDF